MGGQSELGLEAGDGVFTGGLWWSISPLPTRKYLGAAGISPGEISVTSRAWLGFLQERQVTWLVP